MRINLKSVALLLFLFCWVCVVMLCFVFVFRIWYFVLLGRCSFLVTLMIAVVMPACAVMAILSLLLANAFNLRLHFIQFVCSTKHAQHKHTLSHMWSEERKFIDLIPVGAHIQPHTKFTKNKRLRGKHRKQPKRYQLTHTHTHIQTYSVVVKCFVASNTCEPKQQYQSLLKTKMTKWTNWEN